MKRTPLHRRTPLRQTSALKRSAPKPWRRADDDKVTPDVAEHVFARDGGCLAPILDPDSLPCHDAFGGIIDRTDRRGLTLQHVWLDYSVKGDRAPSDPEHLLVLCAGHHLGRWATNRVNLEKQRAYLKRLIAEGRA